MAKPTPITPPPSNSQAASVVNTKEALAALDRAGPATTDDVSAEALQTEKQINEILKSSDLTGLLEKVTKAKAEDFTVKSERDFWKPTEAGQPQFIQGIYLASAKAGRLIQHAFVVKGRDGGPLVMRVNGAHGLTRELMKLQPKDLVRVEFKGQTGTMSGNKFGQWEVTKLG